MVATSRRTPARIGEATRKPRRRAEDRDPAAVGRDSARVSGRATEVAVVAVMFGAPQWWVGEHQPSGAAPQPDLPCGGFPTQSYDGSSTRSPGTTTEFS